MGFWNDLWDGDFDSIFNDAVEDVGDWISGSNDTSIPSTTTTTPTPTVPDNTDVLFGEFQGLSINDSTANYTEYFVLGFTGLVLYYLSKL